jgi:drug/metabolite transporter (DMT)-like permease
MKNIKGILYVVAAAVIFGFLPFFTKVVLANGFNETTFIFVRSIFTTVFIYALIKKKGISLKLDDVKFIDIVKVGFFGYGGMLYALILSYKFMPTGIASAIHFVYPLAVMVGGVLYYNEKFNIKKMATVVLALAGIFLIIGLDNEGSISILGFILALLSGILYAYYMLEVGSGSFKKMNSLKVVFYVSVSNIFLFLIASIITGNFTFNADFTGYFYVLIIAALTLVGMIAIKLGLERVNVVTASIISTFEPLTSLVVGVLLLGEILLFNHIIGSLLILVSVIFASILDKKDRTIGKSELEKKAR